MEQTSHSAYTENPVARTLDNGMAVTLERLPYLHSATAGVWIRTGSANERKPQSGISHFLEHLFFKGTQSRTARQLIEPIESKGGHLNAFTSREYTCIYVRTLDAHIATGIEILADIVKNSTFQDLDKERNVVLEEIASIEDMPEDHIHDLLARHLWPNHALGRSVSGATETVLRITLEDARKYYEAWYRPQSIYFSVAGNFDEHAVLDQICREFGALIPRRSPKRLGAPKFNSGRAIVTRDIAQQHVCLGFPGPTVSDPRRYVYDIMSSMLGGGSTSRLFQRIREDEGLAYSIYSFHSCYFAAGMFGVYAAVAPENFARTLDLLFEELRAFRDGQIDPAELDAHREHLKGSMLMSLENTFNRMARMAKSMMYYKRLLSIEEIIQTLDSVTIEEVQDLARKILKPDQCAMVILGPLEESPVRDIPL